MLEGRFEHVGVVAAVSSNRERVFRVCDERGAEPEAHWHFSPDSLGVREKVDYVLQRPSPGPQTRVQAVEP